MEHFHIMTYVKQQAILVKFIYFRLTIN